ncbi:MAG: riboflavin synthase [Synergistaceae bacterium]|jgi:riboflavin synthase|nr:riboflavin synthase [Synergistaceae bacterium]NCB94667.1 riboflavin synthase [Clostridia bacterium]NCC62162.1 riboflavin synthase [Verrucomicrobiae bacterium]MCK9435965.1 riboflavin synthase [Synergistaceae bacterium]MDD2350535.1 riboflavin synthase [Synergistaceae bacterium]
MFTGLIETIGIISAIHPRGDVWQIDIEAPKIAGELRLGDSVSVSGACSTVVRSDNRSFSIEIMEETRKKTKLGNLKSGSAVNLERAMRVDSRLDGHIVSGHIDGLARVEKIETYPETRKYYFSAGQDLISGIVSKGSVAIDGISLTVIDVTTNNFSVGIIPTTISETTLSELKEGDAVNIETDILGKYITKFLKTRFSDTAEGGEMKNSLTWDKLVKYGWV